MTEQTARERYAYRLALKTADLMARHYANLGTRLDVDDLHGAAMLGAAKALKEFDETRGTAFASFAIGKIRGAILDEIREQDYLNRGQRTRVKHLLAERLLTDPDADVLDVMPAGWGPLLSLEELMADAESADRIAAPNDTEAEALAAVTEEALWEAAGSLPGQWGRIVRLHIWDDMTLVEIGREIGRSPQRVKQLWLCGREAMRPFLQDLGIGR